MEEVFFIFFCFWDVIVLVILNKNCFIVKGDGVFFVLMIGLSIVIFFFGREVKVDCFSSFMSV